MESKVKYRKLTSKDAGYRLVMEAKKRGIWVCDSYDHNEPEGCSNPDCFKYPKEVTVSFPGLEE